jgi:hypothetical protein
MAPPTVIHHTKEEILELAKGCSLKRELATKMGIRPSTLTTYLHREGIMAEVEAAHKAAPGAGAIGSEVAEVEVLRQRVSELEKQHRAQRKIEVVEERALQVMEAAIEARKPSYSPRVIPKSKRSSSQHEFVLLWSDTHAGEVVSEVETNGINSYDWKTMMRRHDRIREAVFSYQDNRPYPVSRLHVCGLGDMLSGNIHDELVETNEMPLAEATVQFGIDGSTFLESFLERFEGINFSGVIGNHPRSKKKPQAKLAFDNGDWLVYHAMQAHLRRQKRITFDIPKSSAHPIEIANRRCLLLHGHGIRSTMPGVPWGGVVRRVTALDQQYAAKGMPLDHYFLGHFHQANAVLQGRVLMNGSVKGPDEFSLQAFGGGSEPQQLLLTFHPRRGLTDVSYIDCT